MKDSFKVKGTVHLVLTDENGFIKLDFTVPNLVVATGTAFIASRMASASASVMSHMAVGTDNTTPVLGDTTLGAEVGRVALTSATPSAGDVVYIATFGPGVGTGALEEAGLFNDPTTGTMLCRTTYPLVNKGASDTLQITWTISVN